MTPIKEVKLEIKNMLANSNEVRVCQETEKTTKLIKITGTLTSLIQLRGEGTQEPYYYSFIRLKGQSIDLPVIFKIKDQVEKLLGPPLKKSDSVELIGIYST